MKLNKKDEEAKYQDLEAQARAHFASAPAAAGAAPGAMPLWLVAILAAFKALIDNLPAKAP